jgi:hypothetical protein
MRILTVAAIALLLPAAAVANTRAETRITHGFLHLGMAHSRAVCYGETIGGNLDQHQAARAASMVESAGSSQQLREAVVKSGKPMINAFTAAHERCGGS